ncbi:hypothetical protein D3C80_770790 [compost metagenome]
MPHCRRFLGVNSVTNIEPNKGDLPAPIIRNAYWFEKLTHRHSSDAAYQSVSRGALARKCAVKMHEHASYPMFSIVAECRVASGGEPSLCRAD